MEDVAKYMVSTIVVDTTASPGEFVSSVVANSSHSEWVDEPLITSIKLHHLNELLHYIILAS